MSDFLCRDSDNLDPFYRRHGTPHRDHDAERSTMDRCDHSWSALEPLPGRTEVPATKDEPGYWLAYANCPRCHTTLCRELPL